MTATGKCQINVLKKIKRFLLNPQVYFYIQGLHLGQIPKGPIGQFGDAVSLQLENFQTGQTLEGQTLHLTYAVPVQLAEKEKEKRKTAKTLERQ